MAAARRYQRIEETVAVRYVEGDVESEQAIRGWLGLKVNEPIRLQPGAWLVKRRGDGNMYVVRDEDFKNEFVEVIDV